MEKTLSSREIFKGRVFTLRQDQVELEDGRHSTREIIVHPGAVAILPLFSPTQIVMIRQFRKALEKVIYEIPAGTLEVGESIEVCAQRELGEETGYHAKKITPLVNFYPAGGYSNEMIYLFLAEGLTPIKRKLDSDEQIEVVLMDLKKVKQLIREKLIEDCKTLIAVAAWQGLFE